MSSTCLQALKDHKDLFKILIFNANAVVFKAENPGMLVPWLGANLDLDRAVRLSELDCIGYQVLKQKNQPFPVPTHSRASRRQNLGGIRTRIRILLFRRDSNCRCLTNRIGQSINE